MTTLIEKFKALETESTPGQEVRQATNNLNEIMIGEKYNGTPVNFSHGDVDAFPPTPGALEAWEKGFKKGGKQAYTEYRGAGKIREGVAERLGKFTGKPVSPDNDLIITPGSQGAIFLALGATVTSGTKVAIVEPDYYAFRKLVKFFGGEIISIPLNYMGNPIDNGPDLNRIEEAFKQGAEVFVFTTPNNPTGLVYSSDSINTISTLAEKYNVTLIVDQLYSRMLYSGEVYTHTRACETLPENIITIMGPSKTESLSGFRLGVAVGTPSLIDRMEPLQGIVSLRASGYNQAVLDTWFKEPAGWLEKRILEHEAIRDDLLKVFRSAGLPTATPQAGSYLFPQLPKLKVEPSVFVRLLRYQESITVTPGNVFAPGSDDSIRLNFSQDHKVAVQAAERIVKMVEVYRK